MPISGGLAALSKGVHEEKCVCVCAKFKFSRYFDSDQDVPFDPHASGPPRTVA
jgi:hypothetical protein